MAQDTSSYQGEADSICQCDDCRHYLGEGRCTAFPQGIPLAILSNEVSHCHPVSGDHGILFEPRE